MKRHTIRWSGRQVATATGLTLEIYCTVCGLPTSHTAFTRRDGKHWSDFPVHDDPRRLNHLYWPVPS